MLQACRGAAGAWRDTVEAWCADGSWLLCLQVSFLWWGFSDLGYLWVYEEVLMITFFSW